MSNRFILWVYWSAALVNTVGVLILSKGLSNQTLMKTDPLLFGPFGLCMIVVWGLCYYACAESALISPKIGLVFTLEKLMYVTMWIGWMRGDYSLKDVYQDDLFAGVFYSIYGVIDLIYACLFLYTAYRAHQIQQSNLGGSNHSI